MKHDEKIVQALMGKALQDFGFLQKLLGKAKDFEHGITSHGELCTTRCEMGKNDGYFKCNKKAGGVINKSWGYCSPYTVYDAVWKIWQEYQPGPASTVRSTTK